MSLSQQHRMQWAQDIDPVMRCAVSYGRCGGLDGPPVHADGRFGHWRVLLAGRREGPRAGWTVRCGGEGGAEEECGRGGGP